MFIIKLRWLRNKIVLENLPSMPLCLALELLPAEARFLFLFHRLPLCAAFTILSLLRLAVEPATASIVHLPISSITVGVKVQDMSGSTGLLLLLESPSSAGCLHPWARVA